MTPSAPHLRIAIAGASSLRGKEVATLVEERFPVADLRLLDDEVADGVLTEAGGEPVVIQGTNEESFDGCRFAFFTGAREFTARHWQQATRAGATVIDLSGALRSELGAIAWIPALRAKLPSPQAPSGKHKVYSSPSASAIIACTLATALKDAPVERLAIVFFQPVSERGDAGIQELESQTVSLLSLKPISQELYGSQVAFNLLGSYGAAPGETLAGVRTELAAAVAAYLDGRIPVPRIQLVQAPVFHGCAFTALVECAASCQPVDLEIELEAAGIHMAESSTDAPSNISVAGESQIAVARIERDAASESAFWLWGAADNLRLAAANALSIAETLLAS